MRYTLYIISIILLLASCKSSTRFMGHSYDHTVSSMREAIRSAATEAKTPAKGLEVLNQWITHINTNELNKTEQERNELLSLCYRYKADAYSILGAYNLSFKNYTKAIELDKNNRNAYFNFGALYTNKLNKHKKALKIFNDLIKYNPEFADAHFARGKVNEKMGNYVDAIINYSKAIEVDKTKQEYKDNKTVMYMHLHKSENAINEASQLISLFPKDAEAYELRANSYYMAKQFNKALEDYNKLILLNSEPAFYSLRAACLVAMREYSKAITDYTQAMDEQESNNGLLYSMRGGVYEKLQQYDKAMADHNKAVKILPDNPVPYAYRGHTHLLMAEYNKAIADYTDAISGYSSAEYYRFRGNAFRALKNYEQAFDDYNESIEICPEMWGTYIASIYYDRGVAFFETGDNKNALKDFHKAQENDPDDDEEIKGSINEYIKKIK